MSRSLTGSYATSRSIHRLPPSRIAVLAVAGLLLAACAGGPSNTATRPAPTATAVPSPAPTSTEAARAELMDAIGATLHGELLELDLAYQDQPGSVYVEWDIAGGDTNQAIIDGAREDTVAILRPIARSGLATVGVRVSGWYTITVDINLNTEHTEMLNLFYSSEKLGEINWDQVKAQFIWVISDSGTLHRLFQQ